MCIYPSTIELHNGLYLSCYNSQQRALVQVHGRARILRPKGLSRQSPECRHTSNHGNPLMHSRRSGGGKTRAGTPGSRWSGREQSGRCSGKTMTKCTRVNIRAPSMVGVCVYVVRYNNWVMCVCTHSLWHQSTPPTTGSQWRSATTQSGTGMWRGQWPCRGL